MMTGWEFLEKEDILLEFPQFPFHLIVFSVLWEFQLNDPHF